VVVEFDATPAIVEEVKADTATVVVDAGPFTAAIAAQNLTPAVSTAAVERVSIAPFARPDGATYARVRITVRGEATHQLRHTGARLYVDFGTPPAAPPAVRGPEASPVSNTKAEDSTASGSTRPIAEPPPPAPILPPLAGTDPETAYRSLDATVRTRAELLASRPDVKGLLRLRSEVERRDKELGNKQPDLVGPLLTELQQMTDQARALQLARDRESILKDPSPK